MAEGTGPIGHGRNIAQDVSRAGTPVETIVKVLKGLSRGGRALELGVGTGRIALPLAATGVPVTGIDSSAEMLDLLRAKPGGAELSVLLGNFRDLQGGPYDLIYAVSDTFCQLLEQDDQIACFANVGQALTEGGIFLVETTLFPGWGAAPVSMKETGDERVVLHVCGYDVATQVVTGAKLSFTREGVRAFPSRMRHTPPAELDLMARIAGLTFKDRWGDWSGTPLTSASTGARVVSLYQLERNW